MSDWEGDDWQRNRTDDAVITPGEQAYHAANEARQLRNKLAQVSKERDELREALEAMMEGMEGPPNERGVWGCRVIPSHRACSMAAKALANLNKTDGE